MAKKPKKTAAKKRKEAPPSDAAPAGFSLENLGFDYAAAVKRLHKAKSSVSVPEIRKCVADIDYKKNLPAIAAIMCFGCCICNSMLIMICGFVLYVVGPSLVSEKNWEGFKENCESVTEYIALKTGEIRELDWAWVKENRKKLEQRSEKKVQARLETTASKKEESVGKDMEVDKERDAAARAVLDPCTRDQLMHIIRDGLEIRRTTLAKPQAIDVIVKKLRDEALGLQAVWKSNSTRCCPRDRVCSTLTSTQVRGNGPARGAVKNVLRCGRRRGRGPGEAVRGVRPWPRAATHTYYTSRKEQLLRRQGRVPGGRGSSLRRVDYREKE